MRILKYRKTDRPNAKNAETSRDQGRADEDARHPWRHGSRDARRGQGQGREGAARVSQDRSRDDRGHQHREEASQGASAEEQSGIIEMPAPIHHSNVMLLDPKSGKPTRVKARIDEDGTKERLAVKSGEAIPRSR